MRSPLTVTLAPASESRVTRETLFSLYGLALREFVESVYGWDESFQKQRFDATYAEKDTFIVLAGTIVAGYVVVEERSESNHIALLLLPPEFQRVGIGREVMYKVIAQAKSRGKPVTLSCFKSNEAALQFYQRLGFIVHEEEPHFVLLTSAA